MPMDRTMVVISRKLVFVPISNGHVRQERLSVLMKALAAKLQQDREANKLSVSALLTPAVCEPGGFAVETAPATTVAASAGVIAKVFAAVQGCSPDVAPPKAERAEVVPRKADDDIPDTCEKGHRFRLADSLREETARAWEQQSRKTRRQAAVNTIARFWKRWMCRKHAAVTTIARVWKLWHSEFRPATSGDAEVDSSDGCVASGASRQQVRNQNRRRKLKANREKEADDWRLLRSAAAQASEEDAAAEVASCDAELAQLHAAYAQIADDEAEALVGQARRCIGEIAPTGAVVGASCACRPPIDGVGGSRLDFSLQVSGCTDGEIRLLASPLYRYLAGSFNEGTCTLRVNDLTLAWPHGVYAEAPIAELSARMFGDDVGEESC